MLNRTNRWAVLACVAVMCMAWPSAAQDAGVFEIQADVDGDGIVGPTDIQHVINDALGLGSRNPDDVNIRFRPYVVASPRASIAPIMSTDVLDASGCGAFGAVSNFPRGEGRILAAPGTIVAFRYDRNVEGVWHEGACGLIRSELLVEVARPVGSEGEGEGEGDGDGTNTDPNRDPVSGKETHPEEIEWVPLGRDGAEGGHCGPKFGSANVVVPFRFENSGDYLIRCTIDTVAVPVNIETEEPLLCGAVRKVNHVFVQVRVLGAAPTDEDIAWVRELQAKPIPFANGFGFRHELDPDAVLPPR